MIQVKKCVCGGIPVLITQHHTRPKPSEYFVRCNQCKKHTNPTIAGQDVALKAWNKIAVQKIQDDKGDEKNAD